MKAATLKKLIGLADAHQAADEYKSGHYEWSGGACAIGCTIKDAKKIGIVHKHVKHGDHKALASANGVPELAWRLCDHVFEGLPESERSAWTPRFLRAIRPNADYVDLPARLMARFARKLAADAIRSDVKAAAETVAGLWERRARGDDPPESEWDAARAQADAAWAQADAARDQADAARAQADAAWAQADAARDQADAAWAQFWKWCADALCEELARK